MQAQVYLCLHPLLLSYLLKLLALLVLCGGTTNKESYERVPEKKKDSVSQVPLTSLENLRTLLHCNYHKCLRELFSR